MVRDTWHIGLFFFELNLGRPILSFETATPVCSVALLQPDGTIIHRHAKGNGVHSELIFVFTNELLVEAGLAVDDLGGVIVSAGPGSYTGLRVAASAVKGLLFMTEIPLYAYHTLGGFALGALQDNRFGTADTVMDARRNHLYHQIWKLDDDGIRPESEVTLMELEAIQELRNSGRLVVGTGLERLEAGIHPDKKVISGNSHDIEKENRLAVMPVSKVVDASHILKAVRQGSQKKLHNLLKKVAPEHFEPYYYSGL